jgi:hypothetical protein
MKKSLLLVAVAAIAASTAVAHADPVFNTDVDTPPGVFFGTGNANGAFTVVNDATDGIQLGLRGKLAVIAPPVTPVGGNTDMYDLPSGAEPGSPSRAAWNVDYSISVAGSKNDLSSYIAELTVTDTTTTTSVATWDVLGNSTASIPHVTDDTFSNASGSVQHKNSPIVLGDVVAQNSENASFFPGLNYNSLDAYTFTLSIFTDSNGLAGNLLASDTIVINAEPTPLPSAANMGIGMLVVIGAAGMLRKKLRTA